MGPAWFNVSEIHQSTDEESPAIRVRVEIGAWKDAPDFWKCDVMVELPYKDMRLSEIEREAKEKVMCIFAEISSLAARP